MTVELAHRLEVQEILLIVNKVPFGMDHSLLKGQIETNYKASVIGMLPLNAEMAGLASSGLFALRHPDHPLTQELKSITRRMMS